MRMFENITVKLVLGAAVVSACAMTGRALARVDMRRSRILAETMDGLQMLRVHMLDDLMPVDTALARSQSYVLKAIGESLGSGSVFEAWQAVSRRETARGGKLDSLAAGDCEVLDRLFLRLGNTSADEQRLLFEGAIKEIGALESASRGDMAQKNRLYTALGALAGAAAVVGLV